ncbi:ParA family protein [Clostridium sp. D53t1_180928_C8]|uniref:ParA family protein n=1 Tax=Clostridium sp. D53t1_180928_C8 TaxID=2787101 RepID=UPI0018ABACCC|nr:ParA family protein [Clostridium sp. D53t1_180928_C8]
MVKKVFFGNYKGGVGKTTTVFEIGALLAEMHQKKVLLVDLDPQCSLSKVCSKTSDIKLENINVEETLNFAIELYSEYLKEASKIEILEGQVKTRYLSINNMVKRINKYSNSGGRLEYIPTVLNIKNSRLNDIAEKMAKNTITILSISKIMEDICKENNYDYILFDCPPNSNIITQGVYLYSDYYLIPTILDEISCDGVADYISEVQGTYLKYVYDNNIGGITIKKYFGKRPELIGVLITMLKTSSTSISNEELLTNLDLIISRVLENNKSLVTDSQYVATNKKHIFDVSIRHLNNRSNPQNYGVPITVNNGDIHSEYKEIANILNKII